MSNTASGHMQGKTPLPRAVIVLLMAVSAPACSSDSSTAPQPGTPASLEILSGNGQSAVVGTELPEPLVARALDANGNPVSGVVINFVVTQGGGSIFAGSNSTNANGEVRERWTLGTTAGEQAVEARAVDQTTGEKITFATFTATALAGAPAALAKSAGNNQTAAVGSAPSRLASGEDI